MRTDTLTYTYQMRTTPERFYQVMIAQQAAFFRSKEQKNLSARTLKLI